LQTRAAPVADKKKVKKDSDDEDAFDADDNSDEDITNRYQDEDDIPDDAQDTNP
jgi:hypothetical protein